MDQHEPYDPKTPTNPMITLIAPRGVTRMAGAKVYAAKLATAIYEQGETKAVVVVSYLRQPPLRTKSISLAQLCLESQLGGSLNSYALVIIPAHHIGFRRYP